MSIGIRVARTFGVTLFKDRDVRRQQVQHALPPVVAQFGMKRADDRTRGLTVCHRSEEHKSELQSLMRISYAVFCLKKQRIPQDRYPHGHITRQIDIPICNSK